MGNRLVIHNNINGKRVNSLYYHWSADAISGVTELAKFLIAMYKVYNKADEKEATKDFKTGSCYVDGRRGHRCYFIKHKKKNGERKK